MRRFLYIILLILTAVFTAEGALVQTTYTESGRPSDTAHPAISGTPDYSATFSYDLNSNPLTITRKGLKDIGSALPPIRPATFSLDANKGEAISTVRYTFGTIDDLSFEREGNRLRSVSDAAAPLTYAGAADFVDGADEAEEYAYDANGNMTMDLNRGIDEILYNELNLPAIIRTEDGTEIRNYYAADGRLLKREIRPGVAKVTREVYIADFIFNQNAVKRLTLKQTNTPTGYITRDGQVHSFLKDYQGNVRQVISENGTVEQESHYYPYGMLMGESTLTKPNDADANRYRISGKEYVTAAGLNSYDQTARFYNPATIQFGSADPVRENSLRMSQFTYCNANPIMFIDPTGESAEVTYFDNGIAEVASKLYFYGTYASEELSRKIADGIACNWNAANATIIHEGKEYKVKFKITYETVSVEKATELAKNNTSPKNNFIRIEKGKNQSFTSKSRNSNITGSNSMWLDITDDLSNSKTPAHEFGHLLGLKHPSMDFSNYKGRPSIMIGRNTKFGPNWSVKGPNGMRVVNPNSRSVTKDDINNAFKQNWGKGVLKSENFNEIIPADPFVD